MQEVRPLSKDVCIELGRDLSSKDSHYPIEKIYHILRKDLSHEQILELEAEYVLQCIYKETDISETDNDPLFIEKLYAIPALLNSTVLVTDSLMAFYKACAVCNNVPDSADSIEDIGILPPQFIHRTFLAINSMMPDDMDFSEMYLYSNVRMFIYNTYKESDSRILNPAVEYLQNEFLESSFSIAQSDHLKKTIKKLRPDLDRLHRTILKSIINRPGEHAEDEYYLYKSLMEDDEDLGAVTVRLLRDGYYRIENEVFEKYPDYTYDGVLVRRYVSELLYAYLFPYLATEEANKKSILAVDFDSYVTEKGKSYKQGLLQARAGASALKLDTFDNPVFYVFATPPNAELAEDAADDLNRDIGIPFEVKTITDYDNILENISQSMYVKYGPPGRLVIISARRDDIYKAFKAKSKDREDRGWPVAIL